MFSNSWSGCGYLFTVGCVPEHHQFLNLSDVSATFGHLGIHRQILDGSRIRNEISNCGFTDLSKSNIKQSYHFR